MSRNSPSTVKGSILNFFFCSFILRKLMEINKMAGKRRITHSIKGPPKVCIKCSKLKPLSAYGISNKTISGLKGTCKACNRQQARESLDRLANDVRAKDKWETNDPNTKFCAKCKKELALEAFGDTSATKNHQTVKGKRSYCHKCDTDISIESKASKRIQTGEIKFDHTRRMYAMFSDYGLTELEYQRIMNRQKGCCAICSTDFSELPKRAHVDHCHKKNIVRGLLCQQCNMMLGTARDNINILLSSATYLEEHN
jgi:hypothetical protein